MKRDAVGHAIQVHQYQAMNTAHISLYSRCCTRQQRVQIAFQLSSDWDQALRRYGSWTADDIDFWTVQLAELVKITTHRIKYMQYSSMKDYIEIGKRELTWAILESKRRRRRPS